MWDLIVSVPDHCISFYVFTSFSKIAFSDVFTDFENRTRPNMRLFFGRGPQGYTLQRKFSPFFNHKFPPISHTSV